MLTLVDNYSGGCLALKVATSLPGAKMMVVLERVPDSRGEPKVMMVDNEPEFIGKSLDTWAYKQNIGLHFVEAGKPVQNAYIERFYGKFRDAFLNPHWFSGFSEAESHRGSVAPRLQHGPAPQPSRIPHAVEGAPRRNIFFGRTLRIIGLDLGSRSA